MPRSLLESIRRRLGVLPPGATVDPAAFPEDEYPLCCLECGYPLHGPADGRCPECGTAFTRARLLVDTYARRRRPRRDPRRRLVRRLWWLTAAAYALLFLTMIGWLIALRIAPLAALEVRHETVRIMLVIWPTALFIALSAGIPAAILDMRSLPPLEKRRAVRVAAREDTPPSQGRAGGG